MNTIKKYITPGTPVPAIYADILNNPHVLIAGTTGAGKSTVTAGLIYTAATLHSPARTQIVLIDPKRVDLQQFKQLPHVLKHTTEPNDIIAVLNNAVTVIETRYKIMETNGETQYNGTDIYIIIDEIADLMLTNKKNILPPLQRILQIGRAAKVHIIACTQCALAGSIIPTPLKVNFPARLGLRTLSGQDSRNIINIKGCENLPQYGKGIYLSPQGYKTIDLPKIPDEKIKQLIKYWNGQECIAR